jgi:hypothetical protein
MPSAAIRLCNACEGLPDWCGAGGFVPVPTFEEVLARFRDEPIAINVEIKNVPTDPEGFDPLDEKLLPAMVALVARHPEYIPDRILVSSFNFKTTTHLKAVAPEIPVAFLTINPADAHGELAFAKATGCRPFSRRTTA